MGPHELILAFFAVASAIPAADILGRKLGLRKLPGYLSVTGIAVSLTLTLFLRLGVYKPSPSTPLLAAELAVDELTKLLLQLFVGVGLASAVYSLKYMEREEGLGAYYMLLTLLVTGVAGALLAHDLYTFYCFWELVSVTAYALVGFRWRHWEPVEAGFKYLVISTTGALLTLYAISLIYGITGTTDFDGVKIALEKAGSGRTLALIAALFLIGLGTSAAAVPFHTWLPDAHPAAPSPVSALLSGVVVNVPLYLLTRLFLQIMPPVKGVGYALAFMGLSSCLLGNAAALRQVDVKRFLAYSTIANVGYMLVALSAAYRAELAGMAGQAMDAATAVFVQMVNHSLSKSALFLCFGNAIKEVESRAFTSLEGVGRRMRVTGALSVLAFLNLAGIPPMAGYWGKMLLTAGLAFDLSNPIAVLTLAVLEANFALAAGYYAFSSYRLFKRRRLRAEEAPLLMLVPELSLTAITLALSIDPSMLVELVRSCVKPLAG